MRREKVGHIRICGARGRLRRQTELSNCHAWIVIMPVCQSTLIGQNWLYSLEKHHVLVVVDENCTLKVFCFGYTLLHS
ncbi:Transforming growth factor beta-3 proprotein [Trichinella pseudospiralis]